VPGLPPVYPSVSARSTADPLVGALRLADGAAGAARGITGEAGAGASDARLPRTITPRPQRRGGAAKVGRDDAGQIPARVNVTCVTPLGEEVASTS
jgi:hypothetical protein